MDIFFSDPEAIPVPPDEVRILTLEANALPDGQRVAVHFALTPFQKRPDVEIEIYDPEGKLAAELSVVEVLQSKMDLILHIRRAATTGWHSVRMKVVYTELGDFQAEEGEQTAAGEILRQTSRTIDQAETAFEILPPSPAGG